jgi:hypothetical protein
LDSLTTLELRETLQSALKISLPPSVFFDYPTLNDLAAYLSQAVPLQTAGRRPDNSREQSMSAKPAPSKPIPRNGEPSPEERNAAEQATRAKLMEIAQELSQWDDLRHE